jgi:hypothetical protein
VGTPSWRFCSERERETHLLESEASRECDQLVMGSTSRIPAENYSLISEDIGGLVDDTCFEILQRPKQSGSKWETLIVKPSSSGEISGLFIHDFPQCSQYLSMNSTSREFSTCLKHNSFFRTSIRAPTSSDSF